MSRQDTLGSKGGPVHSACGCQRDSGRHALGHFQLAGMIKELPDSSSKAGTKQMKYLEQK
jgi:hypothetical protein